MGTGGTDVEGVGLTEDPAVLTGMNTAPEGATTEPEVGGEAEVAAGVEVLYTGGGGVALSMRADGLVICKNGNEH